MPKEIVKYNNQMNTVSLKSYTPYDLDILYAICSQVKERGEDIVYIDFDDMAEMIDYKREHDLLADIKRARSKIIKTSWQGNIEDGVSREGNLFSTFDIDENNERVRVRVNVDFQDYFNNLVSNFTRFELKQFAQLESRYSKSLYKNLRQWKSRGEVSYSIDELKEKLDTPNYETKTLMRDVIRPVIEEFKEKKTFANIWFEPIYARKRGKPIKALMFHFKTVEGQQSLFTYEGGKYMPTADEEPRKATTKRRKKNSFDMSEKQDYDFDALEQQIISNK